MNRISTLLSSVFPIVLLSLAAGCSNKTEPEPNVATPPGPAKDVHEISTARCEREQTCGNVGAGKTYESTDQCVTKLDADGYADLNSADCKAGIDRTQLDKCLSAIKAEECNSPMDSLERVVDCRSTALCRD
jgi:Family of unknown function (DUF6184)